MLSTLIRQGLRCPACQSALTEDMTALTCPSCSKSYPLVGGVPILIHEQNSLFSVSDFT